MVKFSPLDQFVVKTSKKHGAVNLNDGSTVNEREIKDLS